jgi:Cu/Ag efflux protein CusF
MNILAQPQRIAALALVALVGSSQAQSSPSTDAHASQHAAPAATAGAARSAPATEGEVRKIDRAQAKLMLKHGPIENLDMGAMTMNFRVADPKLLDGLKEGDKVRFSADRVNGVIMVTAIEPAAR